VTGYRDRLVEAMALCAAEGALFLGQALRYNGTAMTETFARVPPEHLVELPVFENTQLGMATGVAVATGKPVVSVFPRINFLLCAVDQLVLHLDALPLYSAYRPRVLIRTAVAHPVPLDPGPQHLGDYGFALRGLLRTVRVVQLKDAEAIVPSYREALAREGSTVLVEYHRLYAEEA